MIAAVAESLTGRLLVATPALVDPNFARSVVLLCAHGDTGAFGLVLNQPLSDERVNNALPAWSEHVSEPPVLFRGGPVEPGVAVALGGTNGRQPPEGVIDVIPGVGLVDMERDPHEVGPGLSGARVFRGYSGWGAGQLEDEIARGSWFVVPAERADAFRPDPANLWQEVLRRQAGKLAMFAHFPVEPNLN